MGLDLSEYLDDFLQDAKELLQDLDENLLRLEKHPDDAETINVLFRIAHSLKGSSSLVGLDEMKEYTHTLESIIAKLRSNEWRMDGELFNVLFEAFGFLRESLKALEEQGKEDSEALQRRIGELKEFLGRTRGKGESGSGSERESRSGKCASLNLDFPELGDTIRVHVGKLDDLLNNLGELVIARTKTMELLEKACVADGGAVRDDLLKLKESLCEEGRIIAGVQEAIMKARMLPIRHLFERCPRIVREAASKLGKEVEVRVSGAATELDKKMIDALTKPFMHLLTNAVCHGIEDAEYRVRQGKPRAGSIRIDAFNRHNQVIVTVEDDGRGVDLSKVREKARDLRLLEEGEERELTPQELFEVLATPGFSSAEKVTELSGRGVGLDVVRSGIESVNGSVEATSREGKGMKFTIRLPLTLVIMPVVMFSYRSTVFAVPMAYVQEVIRRSAAVTRSLSNGGSMLEMRGEVVPIIDLDRLMTFREGEAGDCPYLLIVGLESNRVAVSVEKLLGEKEIVVKNLHPLTMPSNLISGASVLGSGDIALILDVFSLFKARNSQRRSVSSQHSPGDSPRARS
jgi:two-component system chemotaxis sensor kinase CheA